MKERNIKVGDRVMCVEDLFGWRTIGKCGVVIEIDDDDNAICVEFNEFIGGHSRGGLGKDGRCLWLESGNLVLLKSNEFKVGDRVRCVKGVKGYERDGSQTLGKCGTVIYIDKDDDTICVEFDEYVDGHSCCYRGKEGHCLWIIGDAEVELIEKPTNKEIKDMAKNNKKKDTFSKAEAEGLAQLMSDLFGIFEEEVKTEPQKEEKVKEEPKKEEQEKTPQEAFDEMLEGIAHSFDEMPAEVKYPIMMMVINRLGKELPKAKKEYEEAMFGSLTSVFVGNIYRSIFNED